jgi:hypothetical protein
MTGWMVSIAFILLTVSHAAVYFAGRFGAKREADRFNAEQAARKAESEREYKTEKANILSEAGKNAEKQKAELSTGGGRDRFDAVNDVLRK